MNLRMDNKIAEQYNSNSQKIRVITEQWVNDNLFCPYCGKAHIAHFENNRPVADFYCPDCAEEYELKSKNGTIENKINDGAYDTMIQRIVSINNPGQKNRTPSQRRPYKNTYVFMILLLLYASCINLSTFYCKKNT